MRCWLHVWSKWSRPYPYKYIDRLEAQSRICRRCDKVEERTI